jgi:hypothetical protein
VLAHGPLVGLAVSGAATAYLPLLQGAATHTQRGPHMIALHAQTCASSGLASSSYDSSGCASSSYASSGFTACTGGSSLSFELAGGALDPAPLSLEFARGANGQPPGAVAAGRGGTVLLGTAAPWEPLPAATQQQQQQEQLWFLPEVRDPPAPSPPLALRAGAAHSTHSMQVPLLAAQLQAVAPHLMQISGASGAEVSAQALAPGVFCLHMRGTCLAVELAGQLVSSLVQGTG